MRLIILLTIFFISLPSHGEFGVGGGITASTITAGETRTLGSSQLSFGLMGYNYLNQEMDLRTGIIHSKAFVINYQNNERMSHQLEYISLPISLIYYPTDERGVGFFGGINTSLNILSSCSTRKCLDTVNPILISPELGVKSKFSPRWGVEASFSPLPFKAGTREGRVYKRLHSFTIHLNFFY